MYQLFLQLFAKSHKSDATPVKQMNFFEYSSEEQIRIMKAAGRKAQKKQQQLLKEYDARFGRSV